MTTSPWDVRLEPDPLAAPLAAEVVALADRAAAADGVDPLSEDFLLGLTAGPVWSGGDDRPGGEPAGDAPTERTHLLVRDGAGLVGYAQSVVGPPPSAEVVVDPAARRRGVGSALLSAVRRRAPDTRVWAHGDLPAARHTAATASMVPVRALHRMTLDLTGAALPPVSLPPGLTVRPFRPGTDEPAWLAANAATFADHPEQGRLTTKDLHARMAEPWFDAAGFLLVVPDDQPGTVAAYHWTKQVTQESGPVGEVYVVGVTPPWQGRGLALPVTLLGLHHLRGRGIERIHLYVDGDNTRALATYRRLGFTTTATDRMYAWR